MNALNKVQIIGNIVKAPVVKDMGKSQKVANFSVATNRILKDATGTKQEQVEFHNIVAWGKLAEIIEQYVLKWQKIYIEGRLQTRNWEDQPWAKRYITEIIAENILMLSWRTEEQKTSKKEIDLFDNIPF